MAEGRDEAPNSSARNGYLSTEIFRCFQVALDPRKLAVAAVGILAMSIGWYLLSVCFYTDRPVENAAQYTDDGILKRTFKKKSDGTEYTAEERLKEGKKVYERDLAEWKLLDQLAGPGGKIRTMPWFEDRGPNPYLFGTEVVSSPSSTWWNSVSTYLLSQIPVLIEPLFKLLLPVIKIVDPSASTLTRIYLLLVILWSVVVWAFCGGIITRLAAVKLSGKDSITLSQAIQFVVSRYQSYISSPLIPLGVVAGIIIAMALYGFIALIPFVGDVVFYGLLLPLVILGGVVMAVLLLGLVGYPMMYTTLSVEGSDTFDALSRSYNYVLLAPWQYLWYSFLAVVYGAAITFFVVFAGSLAVYLGKFAVTQAPFSETANQKPEYLFAYAPESFGWKELLTKGSPLEVKRVTEVKDGRLVATYPYVNPIEAEEYKKSYWLNNRIAAGLVSFWLIVVLLLLIGFSYSYFWTAVTMIYLLMRKKVDDIEIDEVYLEEDLPIVPPPAPTVVPPVTNPGVASLPVVPAPTPAATTPPVVPPPPVPPVSFTGPVGALGAAPTSPKAPETPPSDPEKKA
ncbi:MAG: hypothetical protein ACRCZF_20495 [Gemmataceae bacterium]